MTPNTLRQAEQGRPEQDDPSTLEVHSGSRFHARPVLLVEQSLVLAADCDTKQAQGVRACFSSALRIRTRTKRSTPLPSNAAGCEGRCSPVCSGCTIESDLAILPCARVATPSGSFAGHVPRSIRLVSSRKSRTSLSHQVSSAQTNLYAEMPERLAAFYSGLGMTETFRFPAAGFPEHIEVTVSGFTLGLTSKEAMLRLAGLQVGSGPPQSEVVLWCEDVENQFARAQELGGRPVRSPQVFNDRILAAWVEDPEGNRVKLVSLVQRDTAGAGDIQSRVEPQSADSKETRPAWLDP